MERTKRPRGCAARGAVAKGGFRRTTETGFASMPPVVGLPWPALGTPGNCGRFIYAKIVPVDCHA
jgi:hypothetical protein